MKLARIGSLRAVGLTAFLAIMVVLSGVLTACGQDASEQFDRSFVQVWLPALPSGQPATRLSSGVVVGDGTKVLTLLNYEEYTPGALSVIVADQANYEASIQAIDPRTGLTLLQLKGAERLSVVNIGAALGRDGQVRAWDWTGSRWEVQHYLKVFAQGQDGLYFTAGQDISQGPFGPVLQEGTVVTDSRGKVVGLAMPLHTRLAIRVGIPSPPIASIESGMKLMDPGAATETWTNGPAHSAVGGGDEGRIAEDFGGLLPQPSDYDQMTLALHRVLGNTGKPVAADDLDLNNRTWSQSLDGTMLVAVYPRPISLTDAAGKTVASAKWVGIQWGRSGGKPNRLIYGSRVYTTEGAFELLADLADLQGSITPI